MLKLTERIGDKAVFSGDLFNVAFPKMAVSMINVQPKNFRGITFCVTNYADGMIPEVSYFRGTLIISVHKLESKNHRGNFVIFEVSSQLQPYLNLAM